jgi:predicted membrane-bound mannosyltransferase
VTETRGSWLDKPLLAALDWERAAYLIILLLAIVSRLYDLGARAMSHDESLHTQFSHYFVSGRGYSHTPLMHGPFLFHVTALSYFLFGDNDFTARLPFAIFGIVLVMLPLVFRKQLGREGALAASFLLLISPSILYHARYIRQEGTILVWSFLTALCVWRYLRTRGSGWLIGLAVVLAFHAADKSTNFFTVALFVGFLAPIALWQIWQARSRAADVTKTLVFAVVIGALMIGASILAELINSRVSGLLDAQALITGSAGGSASSLAYFGVILGMGVAMGVLVYGLLRRFFGEWMQVARDHSPAWNLIVVMVSTTTFMAAPALLLVLNPLWQAVGGEVLINIDLLGDDNSIKTNPQVIGTMASLLVAVGMVGVVLALLWNSERALAIFGVFAGITIPLFTSMFTNTAGIGTGFVGQLGYWMAQHGVQRGGQPLYYYLIVVPLYEYLAIIGFLATLVVLGYQLVLRGVLNGGPGGLLGRESAFVSKLRDLRFPILCVWWAFASWLIFSIAGEKMPWLTVHIALPMIMCSGWFIQRCVDAIRAQPQAGANRRLQAFGAAAGLGILAVLFTVRVLSVPGWQISRSRSC